MVRGEEGVMTGGGVSEVTLGARDKDTTPLLGIWPPIISQSPRPGLSGAAAPLASRWSASGGKVWGGGARRQVILLGPPKSNERHKSLCMQSSSSRTGYRQTQIQHSDLNKL